MARLHLELPDDLADEAQAAGVDIAEVSREALRQELARFRTDKWLAVVAQLPEVGVSHDDVIAAIDAG